MRIPKTPANAAILKLNGLAVRPDQFITAHSDHFYIAAVEFALLHKLINLRDFTPDLSTRQIEQAVADYLTYLGIEL